MNNDKRNLDTQICRQILKVGKRSIALLQKASLWVLR